MPSRKSKPTPAFRPAQPLSFDAIGTHWFIELPDQTDTALITAYITQRIETFDQAYSRFRADSFVTNLSHHRGSFQLPADAEPLFDIYRQLYVITGGLMTPFIGQTLADAGYDTEYSLVPQPLSKPPSWETVLNYNFPMLTMHSPALMDFGAAGKGYLVDIIGVLLEQHKITDYLINAGGDIRVRSTKPAQIGLEHPDDTTTYIGTVQLMNGSLCGSAGNRRAWGQGSAQYHHIIDPVTLQSPRHIKAVWVTAETTLLADALTTALYFTSAQKLAAHFSFDYAIIRSDNSLVHSPGFPATFF